MALRSRAPLNVRAQAAARFIANNYSQEICRIGLRAAWLQLTANTKYGG